MAKIKSFGIRLFVGSEEIGGLKSVDLPETEVTDIDLTTHDTSTGFRVFDGGLKDGGTVTLGGAYDIEDAGQDLLRDPDEQGETYPVAVVFSDGSNATFDAVVKGYGITNPLDENLEFTSSLKISGETNYLSVPPFMVVTGTLTDGTDPITVPLTIPFSVFSGSLPAYEDPGNAEINPISPNGFELLAAGQWESTADVASPDLVPAGAWHASTNPHAWKPVSPSTGTPIVTAKFTN